ncbi:MAG TPA: phage holin family protein, partial [Anaerolineae bacterium]|nr:phage holin family protein [Anaerolineae bacterium]
LAEFMPGWLAALLVGLVVAGIGGLVAYSGLNSLQQMDAKPERTIKSLQEDKQWLQQQLQ